MNGWTFIDIEGVDVGSYVEQAQKVVAEKIQLPAGYSLNWSGQYQYMLRAKEKLKMVVPTTLLVIFILLYLNFRDVTESIIVMLSVPFALTGGLWLIYWLGYNMSVAVAVGFIALAGVAAETGVVMLLYLDISYLKYKTKYGPAFSKRHLNEAIEEGAALRVRPKMMTVVAIIARTCPDHVGQRYRLRGYEADCRPDDWRDAQRNDLDPVGNPDHLCHLERLGPAEGK